MIYSTVVTRETIPCGIAMFQGTEEEIFRKAEKAGYTGIQLTIRTPGDYSLEKLKKLSRETRIQVTGLATGTVYTMDGLGLGCEREELRQGAVERMKALAEMCAELGGAQLIVGAVRGWYRDASSREVYDEQFEKSLRELMAFADLRKVPVILEWIDHKESDVFNDPEAILALIRKIGSPNLYMYLDTLHIYNEGECIPEAILRYGKMVPQIDISGEKRLPPMKSGIDFEKVCRAVRESGFDGVLLMEFHKEKPEDAEESLAMLRGYLEG
ncbi:sugar phosphate isomerase/epimerase family protein [Clostridium vitabionis]|jgi:sugar phosphate isomerase/epimerase|uniref:sugar phosphate isomerase/epimerase family protein n=1 Tax=Clostridium vitabionis TaxID=2784388 RepID=UPI00188B725A|nr:sugar phosphate isomerase/epimerase family protein [Clostridium vitabionis]